MEEEIEIKKMIEEKQRKRGGKCLAEVIDAEMSKKLTGESIRMKNMYQSVYQRCFKETRVGNMDSFKLSEKIICKFRKSVSELYGLNENEMVIFMGMFQVGLNRMSDDGLLDFVPDKGMFQNYLQLKNRISYIDNPYTDEETERIVEWVELHPADIRGLAVNLWFTGGFSLEEIADLKKTDCWGGKGRADSIIKFKTNLLDAGIRAKIVTKALNLHPRDVIYVFVVPRQDGTGWKKLTEIGMQKKLRHICKETGIIYKEIHKNEAIVLDKRGS